MYINLYTETLFNSELQSSKLIDMLISPKDLCKTKGIKRLTFWVEKDEMTEKRYLPLLVFLHTHLK